VTTPANGPASALLRAYVERLNQGVRGGGFEPMAELLAGDAELTFEGIGVGPFRGRAAILEAYRASPPDDTFELLELRDEAPGVVEAVYAWSERPAVAGGSLRASVRDGRIATLLVRYGDDGGSAR
jgi:steroid Delta-isomerase